MTQKNPLLDRIRIPGEIHRLPSRGLFYEQGVLDPNVKDGEVQIHPMTMIDEITARSPDLLYSGEAITKIIGRCVPQILKPEALLSKDVDFLMLILRKASYGDVTIDYNHRCGDEAKDHTYTIQIEPLIRAAKNIDPTMISSKFTITAGQFKIKVQPMLFKTVVNMLQLNDENISPEKAREIGVNSLLDIIVSVDEVTDKQQIAEWLKEVNVAYINKIHKAIENAQNDWGTDLTTSLICKDCGKEERIIVPMNPLAFFI